MKKVLSAFFAVFLSMTGGYCENTSYADTNLSSNDSMNSVISIRAIYESLNMHECFDVESGVKDSIARIIGEIISQGRNITLKAFLSMCINLSVEDESVENCIGCTINIAEKHNELVQQHKQEQINNIDVFTSEEEYNKVLKAKGICTAENSRWKLVVNIRANTVSSCKKTCKNYAIANACILDGIYSNDNCTCTPTGRLSGDYRFFPYYVRPTWEDYKKLYKIK